MGIGGLFFAGWRVVYPSGDKWDGAFPVADTGPPPPSQLPQNASTPLLLVLVSWAYRIRTYLCRRAQCRFRTWTAQSFDHCSGGAYRWGPPSKPSNGESRDMPIENWRCGEHSRTLPTWLFSTNSQTSQTMISCCKERKGGVGCHLLVCLCLRFLTLSQTSDDHPASLSCRWPISRVVMTRTRSKLKMQACQWWGWVARMYSPKRLMSVQAFWTISCAVLFS